MLQPWAIGSNAPLLQGCCIALSGMVLLALPTSDTTKDAMHYKDFRTFAKRYSNLFHYGFGLNSLRNATFWTSIILLYGTGLFAYSAMTRPFAAYIPWWGYYIGMIVCEIFFGLTYFLHIAEELRKKQVAQGAFDLELDHGRDDLDIRKDWLAIHFPIRRDQYLKTVEAVEHIETSLDSARHKKRSAFEAYMSSIFKWTKPAKWIFIFLLTPVAVFVAQAFLERKPWTDPFQPSLNLQNLKALAVIGGGFLVSGAVIAFVTSMIKYLYCYYQDVVSDHACSQSSVDRLLKDLLQLSKLDVEIDLSKPEL